MEKTFLLGVGCQKGGTSWLHNYLSKHPNTNMGFTKEYHIFDALYMPECNRFRHKRTDYASAFMNLKIKFLRRRLMEIKRRKDFCSDTNKYFDYFADNVEPSGGVTLYGRHHAVICRPLARGI